jgi:hypothetical protein
MLDLFPDSARIDEGVLTLGASRRPTSPASSARRSSSTTRRRSARGARLPGGGARRASSLRDEGVPERRAAPALAEEGSAPTSRRSASSASRRRRASPASGSSCTATTSPTRSSRRGGGAAALVVLDALEEIERAPRAGVAASLVRVTPGIEANTHEAIRTGHHGSKFGLPAHDALAARPQAPEIERPPRPHRLAAARLDAALLSVDWLAPFAARVRAETGWDPRTVDLGGGLGVRTTPDEPSARVEEFVPRCSASSSASARCTSCRRRR